MTNLKNVSMILWIFILAVSLPNFSNVNAQTNKVDNKKRQLILESRKRCVAFIGRKVLKNHYDFLAEKEISEFVEQRQSRKTAAKSEEIGKEILFSESFDNKLLDIYLKYAKRSEGGETELEKEFNLNLMTAQIRKVFKSENQSFWKKCFDTHTKVVQNCHSKNDDYEKNRCYKKFDKEISALI
jgi:hypothetical protein